MKAAELRGPLGQVMTTELGAGVEIVSLDRLKGGYSRQMWSFDASAPGGDSRGFVLCIDDPGGVVDRGTSSLTRVQEARLIRALSIHGVLVPDVIGWGDGSSVLGRPWMVMERLEGSASLGPFLRDPGYRSRLDGYAKQMAEALASIHGMPLDVLPDLGAHVDQQYHAAAEVDRWATVLDATPGAATSTNLNAVRWLRANLPPAPHQLRLVHGDYRVGNLLHDVDGFVGVLDWEMAHIGDPAEDVAWAELVCWQAGTGLVGTLVSQLRWRELYQLASENEIDPERVNFWKVLGSVKMASLLWRAIEAIDDPGEQRLLSELFDQLGVALEGRLP